MFACINMKRIISTLIDLGLTACGLLILRLLCFSSSTILYSGIILILFFCRDCITGQSVGRRIMGICVIHAGRPISPFRAFVRNTFLIVWPLELIIFCIYHQKRLGDMVTDSIVEEQHSQQTFHINPIGIAILVTVTLFTIGLYHLFYMANIGMLKLLYS